MERLTTDKPNGMYELAHNGCYIDENGNARYRDFDTDIDARELTRDIMREFVIWEIDDNEMLSDEIFDETIMDNLQYGTKELEGLIALFYRNLWAMADLRERLKHYEDLEEQGLLLKLHCKVGDIFYRIGWNGEVDKCEVDSITLDKDGKFKVRLISEKYRTFFKIAFEEIGKTVFLTKEEAEAKLKEMGCE